MDTGTIITSVFSSLSGSVAGPQRDIWLVLTSHT